MYKVRRAKGASDNAPDEADEELPVAEATPVLAGGMVAVLGLDVAAPKPNHGAILVTAPLIRPHLAPRHHLPQSPSTPPAGASYKSTQTP